jgi:hypothetical protein
LCARTSYMADLRLNCICDYFDCISDCFNYICDYYDYIFDCFNYTSNYYDIIFDYTASLTTSTASPTASTTSLTTRLHLRLLRQHLQLLWLYLRHFDYISDCFKYNSNYYDYLFDHFDYICDYFSIFDSFSVDRELVFWSPEKIYLAKNFQIWKVAYWVSFQQIWCWTLLQKTSLRRSKNLFVTRVLKTGRKLRCESS